MTTAGMQGATDLRARLSSPELRRLVERFVRRRVPSSDIDDLVQTVFCEALAASRPIGDDEELRRWLVGIARHKVADLHRRGAREKPSELDDLPAAPPPLEEQALADWAERQTAGDAEAKRTLGWMAREGAGEKLATIAAEEKVSATAVRQRVSRLRRFMRERWMAELAAVAVVTAVALVVWLVTRAGDERVAPLDPNELVPTVGPVPTAPVPPPTGVAANPAERAARLRAEALEACEAERWAACLEGLDAARRVDPAGDDAPAVREARARAEAALRPPSATAASSTSQLKAPPTTTVAPSSQRPAPSAPTANDPKLLKTTPQAPSSGATSEPTKPLGNQQGSTESDGPATKKKLPSKPTGTTFDGK